MRARPRPAPPEPPAEIAGVPADGDAQATRERIGARLRALRASRGMSLAAAARASGLSRSFIGLVESGSSEIAVSRLIRLADAYGVLAADLLAGAQTTVEAEFVPRGGGHVVPAAADEAAVEYLSSASWPIQPFLVSLPAGSSLTSLTHPGSEFIHCLAGRPTLVVAGRAHPMAAGDTIVIPDHAEHSYLNPGRTVARLIGGVERVTEHPRG